MDEQHFTIRQPKGRKMLRMFRVSTRISKMGLNGLNINLPARA